MSPTTRAAWLCGLAALLALVVPAWVPITACGAVLIATGVDAVRARRTRVDIVRDVAPVVARGVPTPLHVRDCGDASKRVRLRQPAPPDVRVAPQEQLAMLDASVVGVRRGHHELPAVAVRTRGPWGLAVRTATSLPPVPLTVYPDLPAARRLALAVRQGRFRDAGRLSRGPLGLGTEFERIRDYLPDDDVRQVNWAATQRLGRPMSNQFRVEQDRELVCLLDTGRLMAAPVGDDRTRMDAAVDAVAAIACVADAMGDRCGVIAFDREIRRHLAPKRSGARTVVDSVFDLESRAVDSDYDLAFRSVRNTKRALVVVFTDLLDEAAARGLVDAVPVLARRHAVVVAYARDPDVEFALTKPPRAAIDVYAAAVAQQVVDVRERVQHRLRSAGAEIVDAPAALLGETCVRVYLRLKTRARL